MNKYIFWGLVIMLVSACQYDKYNAPKIKLDKAIKDTLPKWDGFACGIENKNIIYPLDSSFYIKIILSHCSEGVFRLPNDSTKIKVQLVYYLHKPNRNGFLNECSDVQLIDFEGKSIIPDTLNCKFGNFTVKIEKYVSNTDFIYNLVIRDAHFFNKQKNLKKEIDFILTNKILYSGIVRG